MHAAGIMGPARDPAGCMNLALDPRLIYDTDRYGWIWGSLCACAPARRHCRRLQPIAIGYSRPSSWPEISHAGMATKISDYGCSGLDRANTWTNSVLICDLRICHEMRYSLYVRRKTSASDGFTQKQWCSKCFYIMMSFYFTCCFVRIDSLQKCGVLLFSLWQALIHRGRMKHVCINKLSHHWLKKWFVAFSGPSYHQTNIQTEPFRKSWMKIELEHITINQIKYIWKCSLQNV